MNMTTDDISINITVFIYSCSVRLVARTVSYVSIADQLLFRRGFKIIHFELKSIFFFYKT